MLRRLCCLLALLSAPLCARPLAAQGLAITQPAPDCRLARRAYDNPFSDTRGYVQPRYAWHAEYAAGALALGYVVHRVTHLPPWASAAVVTLGVGLVPHIRGGLIRRTYPIDPLDWAFDLWDRSTPAWWVVGHRDDSTKTIWRNHVEAAGTWLIGYAALACWASP